MKWGIAIVLATVLGTGPVDVSAQAVDVRTRAAEAERVVVATVFSVQGRFAENEFGDRLIVSDVLLRVDEELKGPFSPFLNVTVEGGALGNLRLEVSDMPVLEPDERAVFFLDEQAPDRYRLHRRDLGVLRLDASGNIEGTTLTLADVRRAVRSVR